MASVRQLNLVVWIAVGAQVACSILIVFVLEYGTAAHKALSIFGAVAALVTLWAILNLNKARKTQ
jgi:hypothetical protein